VTNIPYSGEVLHCVVQEIQMEFKTSSEDRKRKKRNIEEIMEELKRSVNQFLGCCMIIDQHITILQFCCMGVIQS
jgi:hypothetical protein